MNAPTSSGLAKLWPANHLVITADTSEAVDAILHPRNQLRFLDELAVFAGPNIFAGSLVYSTPRGNTGWTALRMGRLGHATYHHWDAAKPNLLQLDVFGSGPIDDSRAMTAVRNFWVPLGMRAILIKRPEPPQKFSTTTLQDDVLRRSGVQEGLGPGEHLHLLVDQTGSLRKRLTSHAIDAALTELVALLRMSGMTPVMSNHHQHSGDFSHDAIVGITTSHLSLRLRQIGSRLSIALDVFSCRNFDPEEVFRWLDNITSTPDARRAVLYHRHPSGALQEL